MTTLIIILPLLAAATLIAYFTGTSIADMVNKRRERKAARDKAELLNVILEP